jgi:type I restriction enzyme R subunit
MDKHKEIVFESDIVQYMTSHGWLEGTSHLYNRELALYPEDLIGFVKDTQPEAWAKLEKFHNGDAADVFVKRVAEQMNKIGCLKVLRTGVKDKGARFTICQFKPDHSLNPDTLERYNKNRLRVVRQVRYSLNNENSIDLVLFVNGIPIATLELKTDFTQSVQHAIRQYKHDRPPKDKKTRNEEPLLAFKKRALVHFAVSSDEVYMTTKLEAKDTFFLPFNTGNKGGSGNPVNKEGYATSYLWEKVFQPDALLNILGRFIHLQVEQKENWQGKKYKKETMIFPRYHQWEVVNKLIDSARQEGGGNSYLIQHSAGSGKSNSIAWTAHRLASLYTDDGDKIFRSVIVITDRTVLDSQLQDTIYQFDHAEGVVQRITRDEGEGSKSAKLADALESGAPIIIVTIQTFPFVLDEIQNRTSLFGHSFAVIADEAHSSQTGATARKLKEVLTAEQIDADEEITAEDVLAATLSARSRQENLSYFAFTATPKAKTLELFGRLPQPDLPPSETNKPRAFHVYTMRQAIEEGFILDVLRNYTTYKMAYKLAHLSPDDDTDVDSKKAKTQVAKWVRLHPYNISQKVEIIIEHFRSRIAHLLNGQAKAMVVTGSRKEAVRYKIAFDNYINTHHYKGIQAMVAFSGEVVDLDSGPEPFTESSMNPGLKGREMREAFDTDEYQVMLVANKFQTGFDQPKLCAMYVDKKLAGVDCVQTLSRLNRTYPGKTTFVLDFFNAAEDVLEAFEPYYETATLADVSDPNLIYDIQHKLEEERIYTEQEVEAFAQVFFSPEGTQGQMNAIIKPPADRFKIRYKEILATLKQLKSLLKDAQKADSQTQIDNVKTAIKEAKEQKDGLDIFKKNLGSFVRFYEFMSQIIDYDDQHLEKLSAFATHLRSVIKTENLDDPIDLSSVEMTHYKLRLLGERDYRLGESEKEYELKPADELGTGTAKDPKTEKLSEIVARLNELFAGELTDNDLINYARTIKDKVMENETVVEQLRHNTKEQAILGDFKDVMLDSVIASMDTHQNLAAQVLKEERVKKGFAKLLLDMIFKEIEGNENKPAI